MENDEPWSVWKQPESSGWKCDVFGMRGQIQVYPRKGHVPNAFWRWMQYICFGNKWTKVK